MTQTNEHERHYPKNADLILAAREDSERYWFAHPHDESHVSTPAMTEEQARKLCSDEHPGVDPDEWEPVNIDEVV